MTSTEFVLYRLSLSKFRSSFKLTKVDRDYVSKKGLAEIEQHALEFITKRLAPAILYKDGKQTPYKGHPVFKAQHATGTCCRTCMSKWHKIEKDKEMNTQEINKMVEIIMVWIRLQYH